MKTQIIQLEVHDDTVSIRDKMDWSQTPRILLVFPDSGRVLRNRLDLILLERYCSSHGSQLALLSSDSDVIYQAQAAGIPVFQNKRSAQLQPWGKSYREFRRKEITQQASAHRELDLFGKTEPDKKMEFPVWVRIAIFAIGVLAVMIIAGFLLPSAVITIPESGIVKTLIVPVKADLDIDIVNISGMIPANELEITVEGKNTGPSTGTVIIPEDYASGEVIFTNLSEASVTIPENSILSTSTDNPIMFITTKSGSTPEGIGEQISIEIKALTAGSDGNVEAAQINRINQTFGADITVTNPEPTSGGTEINVPAPSQADRRSLSSTLELELERSALDGFEGLITDGDVLFPSSLAVKDIFEESSTPLPGFAGDTLTVYKEVQFVIWYTARADINNLAIEILNTQYHGGDYEYIPDSLSLDYQESPASMDDWEIELNWRERKSINSAEIIQLILGKKPSDAEIAIQKSFLLTEKPEITIKPVWWFRLPVLPFRITVIEEGQ